MCITKIMFTKCVFVVVVVVANLCSSVVLLFVCCIYRHECDNILVLILVLFRPVLNSGGRTES